MDILGTMTSRVQALRYVGEISIEGGYDLESMVDDLPTYARKIPGGVEEITIIRKAERQWQVIKKIKTTAEK